MARTTSKKSPKVQKKAATRQTLAKRRQPAAKSSAAPKLLAGGNPQIPKGEGDAMVQACIAAMPGWKSEVGRRLDTLISRNVSRLHKAVKWNLPFYGVEGQGWFLAFHVFTKYIKVTFFRGSSLRPVPPGASKHNEVRYLDIYEGQLDETQFTDWVRQASRLPGERLRNRRAKAERSIGALARQRD